MTNRNPVKQLFFTFPKSTIDKQQFRDDLLRFEPDYYKVVQESHADGTPHLHAVVRFKNKYSKAYVLKYFKGLYPNDYKRIDVKPVRSIKRALLYLSKEDSNPLVSGEYKDNRQPQNNWLNKLAREWGYLDSNDLMEKQREYKRIYEQHRVLINKHYIEHTSYMSNYPGFKVPFRIRRIYEKLCNEDHVTKDDMTSILNYLKIPPLVPFTRGVF